MRHSRLHIVLLVALGLVLPATAQASYRAKINEVRINPDGSPELFATLLDDYGEPPPESAIDSIHVYFGEANELTGGDLDRMRFEDSEEGTDYVIILPGYEGFGVSNAVAAAEGASNFQASYVGENDTALILVYGDGVLPFEGDAIDLTETFREPDGIARVARPYMLSALDEAVRWYDELTPGRRRVIIMVGTGMDVRLTDATNVQHEDQTSEADWDRAFREVLREHTAILMRYIEAIEHVNARVYAIGMNDARPDYLEVLRALARKTGGTFRRVTNIGDLSATGGANGVFDWVGAELSAEYILEPDFSVEAGKEYEIWITFRFPVEEMQQQLNDVTSRPYYLTVEEFQTRMNIIPYVILVGVILVVVFLLLVLLFVMLKRMKARRDDLAERKALKDKIEKGKEFCPTCYRKLQPDWDSCMFCASAMERLEEKPQEMIDAEEAQTRLDELDGKTEEQLAAAAAVVGTAGAVAVYANREGKTLCQTCNRVVDPTWKECMFCAAGMPALPAEADMSVPASELATPMAFGPDGVRPPLTPDAPQAEAAPAPPSTVGVGQRAGGADEAVSVRGMDACPECGRPVPEDWDECLYCKAGV